ncbi:hypothetical protein CHS0354_026187 [Potamilus streckersoni]|uniref:Ig-like domain-containing protein n=1 Tax=Potamilus streckersoni TaxID=2493646 RepID=A0AAE0SUA0_9BIVA|nr:hypothetical protein CHS0354_026187 [Potamilus streckersoni]
MAVVFYFLFFLVTFPNFGHSSNITIQPSMVQAMLLENVTLDCRVNTQDLNYIISKPVIWNHVSNSGVSRQMSIGFYLTANNTRFSLKYENAIGSTTDYSFQLQILGVMDQDDGKFVCQHTSNDSTISMKEVPFTVLHDIESITLEVRIANQTLTSNRSIQPKEPSVYETDVRSWVATCVVNGSNPEPVVKLRVDGNILSVQPNVTSRLVGLRRAFDVKFIQNVSLAGHMNKSVVDVICEAQLPGNRSQLRSAGIRLDVQPGISAVCYSREGKMIGDNVTINCFISANRTALDCSKVTLTNATGNEVLTKVGADSENPNFGRMSLSCDGSNTTRLQIIVTVNSLREVHFSTGLYLRYSSGEETTTTKLYFVLKESPVLADCPKVFANIGRRDLTVKCIVTIPSCSSIRWEGPWQGPPLENMDRKVDTVLGVLESSCKIVEENKKVGADLKISEVTEAIIQANINILYNNNVNLMRMPIQIEKENNKSSHGNSGTVPSERAINLIMLCVLLSVVYK